MEERHIMKEKQIYITQSDFDRLKEDINVKEK